MLIITSIAIISTMLSIGHKIRLGHAKKTKKKIGDIYRDSIRYNIIGSIAYELIAIACIIALLVRYLSEIYH